MENHMDIHGSALKILTMGGFSISVHGKPVAVDWPDETLKVLFCSLLSPLDLYVTWDRICRSMCGEAVTRSNRRRMEEIHIRPLAGFLIKELGFNPFISENDGIRIDRRRVKVDAFEFHCSAIEGLRLLSIGDHAAAHEKFSTAKSLYLGSYLPEIQGKIITSTRNDLESLYLTAILDAMPLTQNSGISGLGRTAETGLQLASSRRPFHTDYREPE